MFLFGSSLASFLQSLCFFIHTRWISLSFCFHLVPKVTVLAKLFFTLLFFPSWHLCPCGLTITFLRKCQPSLASFLSPLLWNLSSSSFLHLFILSHAVLADRLSKKFGACPKDILFHCYSHKSKWKSGPQIKKCKSCLSSLGIPYRLRKFSVWVLGMNNNKKNK